MIRCKASVSALIGAAVMIGVLSFGASAHAAYRPSDPPGKVEVVAQEEPEPEAEAEPGVWDLPMGGFAVALAISALIGAAGGFVYAGIMGPRKPTKRE